MNKYFLQDEAGTVILSIHINLVPVVSVIVAWGSVVEWVDGEGTPLEEDDLETLHEQVEDVADVEAGIL